MPLHIRGNLFAESLEGPQPDPQTQGEAVDLIETRLKAAGL